jgi:hypothetical protein
MELIEAIKQGQPLAVAIYDEDRGVGQRPDITLTAAEVFIVTGAMMWADIGWLATPSHPFHRAAGWAPTQTAPGAWIGLTKPARKAVIAPKIGLHIITPDDPQYVEVEMWRDYQARTPGATRENAWAALTRFFDDMAGVKRIV